MNGQVVFVLKFFLKLALVSIGQRYQYGAAYVQMTLNVIAEVF